MDLGLSVGKKLNENKSLDPANIAKKEQEQQSRSFTLSKWVALGAGAGRLGREGFRGVCEVYV
jgi:hypothetical protein